jgi:uncharacterized protein with PIN domain
MGRATARQEGAQATREPTTLATSFDSPQARSAAFATASHTDLFAEATSTRCDVCNARIDPKSEGEEPGTGVYVWARGDEIRREQVPLCPSCSNAIFASALGYIDYDDEE